MAKKTRSKSTKSSIKVIGFRRRLFATIIDGLILYFLTFAVAAALGFVVMFLNIYNLVDPNRFVWWLLLCALALSLVYYVGYWAKSGQTIGKSAMGLKIVGLDGQPLSLGKAAMRYIGYVISGILFSLGFLWVAFDKKRQGWHDKIAGTYVVENGQEAFDPATTEVIPADSSSGWGWFVLWLVFALAMPGALLSSLWFLSPFLARALGSVVGGG